MLTRSMAIVGVALATCLAPGNARAADGGAVLDCGPGQTYNWVTKSCVGKATDDGSDGGSKDPVESDAPGGKRECRRTGKDKKKIAVACTSRTGFWNNTYECYVGAREDPQPPKSDPIWEGNDDGAIYSCYSQWIPGADSPDGPGSFKRVWLPTRPTVDQEELAHTAVDRMNLRAIEIGLSVPDLPDRMIYVGAPVWLWTADPDAQTLGPNRLSASAGGVTVTAQATLQRVTWSMGDGRTVSCAGPFRAKGTVYKPAFGLEDSPSCGYRYQHPSEQVTITATSHWVVDWRGPGQSGSFSFDLSRNTTRPVGEIQTVVERDT